MIAISKCLAKNRGNILSFTYNAYGFTITGQRSRKSQERFGSLKRKKGADVAVM